ncbi:DUF1214 domain-containing protein [Nocardia tengchongensis]
MIGALLVCATAVACNDSSGSTSSTTTSAAAGAKAQSAPDYPPNQPAIVTAENFARAESDREFAISVEEVGIGNFHHIREPMPIDHQTVVRANRDTLYSSAVFDLNAGPVSITLPDAGDRFMSMQIIDEDEYTPDVVYKAGTYTYDRDKVGTRYMIAAIRTFVDPNNPADVDAVHKLQDAVTIKQDNKGTFEIPQWDKPSQDKVRDALITLASTLPDTKNAFGPRGQVDEVRHLITSASAWGGNPEKDALYLNVTPPENNGQVNYKVHVKDVPVDGFWSISVYNAQGYYDANPYNANSINNVTAKKNADGSFDIQFGGCDGQIPNCLPIEAGWNYMVRLYRPQQSILDGTWAFPQAQRIG